MPIVDAHGKKVLFIHVPKTGGSSVDKMLEAYGPVSFAKPTPTHKGKFNPRHLHAAPLERLFRPGFFDFSFMIVRHPVTRLMSEFRYQNAHRKRFTKVRRKSFSLWLKYSLLRRQNNPGMRDNHFRPQTEFECFDCEVFKIEDGLDAVNDRLADIFGRSKPGIAPYVNATEPEPIKVSASDIDLIVKSYTQDFERYGYDLEHW